MAILSNDVHVTPQVVQNECIARNKLSVRIGNVGPQERLENHE